MKTEKDTQNLFISTNWNKEFVDMRRGIFPKDCEYTIRKIKGENKNEENKLS